MRNIQRLDDSALPMLHYMARRGISVDIPHFEQMDIELTREMERLESEVEQIAGHYVNVSSPPQVANLLFKELGLKQARLKLTKSGDRESTDKDVLVAIQHEHIAVAKIVEYRKLDKLRGTYVRPIPKLAKRSKFGQWRLYPNFKHTRVPSGRYAAADPNLLAMPNRTEWGRRVCMGFITDPGWCLLSVDFSQIEPRIVAHRSQDAKLMAIYHNKEDIYSDFAIGAFKLADKRYKDPESGKWKYPGVDGKAHRFPSKTCILASIYRVSGQGLVEQLPVVCERCGIEAAAHSPLTCPRGFKALWNEDNATGLINAFYIRYAGIGKMQHMDDVRARVHGYTWDEFGRLLHMTAVRSVHPYVVSKALREGGNMPIQGTACGALKLGMAIVQDDLESSGLLGDLVHPLLPVHDEILSECREDVAQEVGEHIAMRFSTVMNLTVPLAAEYNTGPSWGKISK